MLDFGLQDALFNDQQGGHTSIGHFHKNADTASRGVGAVWMTIKRVSHWLLHYSNAFISFKALLEYIVTSPSPIRLFSQKTSPDAKIQVDVGIFPPHLSPSSCVIRQPTFTAML